MTESVKRLKVFSGNSNRDLAREICRCLGIELGQADILRFQDGEIRARNMETVRGAEVFIIQPLNYPSSEYIMELLIMIDAMRRASAKHICAVIPYYAYARQDRKTQPRDPITAKLLANLITNSMRYTHAPGHIAVDWYTEGATVVLTVDDSKPGVNSADLKELFEPLFRADRARQRSADGGSGLGLAIVRSIAQAHGGNVTASPAEAGGLRITVRLPVQGK